MAKSVRRARAYRSQPAPQLNVIYLEHRFPGRFQGPPQDLALINHVRAILLTATLRGA